ncbi:LysR family transcriptional regulator [Rhizobium sp. ICMP 5592]|uniref:LysR family transcriptional regulator n=1 Tax=Rhizobium sp. ICMP 5592 TaxID=2292445 RepID=UPI00129588B0|nr:LysR family transcriptional regulator [Rhizobium sp. ICMP 5592]MQB45655.1 LysR family transcriptional regulator [Rhizobium sp. ICMP 5592]
MSKLPDLEGLALFAKVAEERSFAGAARVMDVSVATVSRGVSRLEDSLGVRLLNRTSRQLSLTDAGRTLAERASQIYCEAEKAENEARDMAGMPRGLIRLAVPMSFGLRWLTPILPDFFRAYPDISIDLHLSDALVDIVADGFDAALRIAVLTDSSLVARRIAPVARFICASPDHIARHGRPMHPRDLDERHCLGYAYRARRDSWRLVSHTGEEEMVTPRGQLRVTNVDALIPMVLSGLGIAELPEFVAAEYLADGRLEVLLPGWPIETGGLYLVTPSTRARPAKIEALAEFLTKRLSQPSWKWPR